MGHCAINGLVNKRQHNLVIIAEKVFSSNDKDKCCLRFPIPPRKAMIDFEQTVITYAKHATRLVKHIVLVQRTASSKHLYNVHR